MTTPKEQYDARKDLETYCRMFDQSTFDRYVVGMKLDDANKLRKLLRQDTNAPLHYWLDILRSHGFDVVTLESK